MKKLNNYFGNSFQQLKSQLQILNRSLPTDFGVEAAGRSVTTTPSDSLGVIASSSCGFISVVKMILG